MACLAFPLRSPQPTSHTSPIWPQGHSLRGFLWSRPPTQNLEQLSRLAETESGKGWVRPRIPALWLDSPEPSVGTGLVMLPRDEQVCLLDTLLFQLRASWRFLIPPKTAPAKKWGKSEGSYLGILVCLDAPSQWLGVVQFFFKNEPLFLWLLRREATFFSSPAQARVQPLTWHSLT